MFADQSIDAFIQSLGSSAPTPGGGAASALAGALAAALAEMVGRFTLGRERYRMAQPQAERIVMRTEELRVDLMALIEADAQAFEVVAAAYRLPRQSEEERGARDIAIQSALHGAIEPPRLVLRAAAESVAIAREIAEVGNASVISDAACAAILGEAAARSAAVNVLANAIHLVDQEFAEDTRAESRAFLAQAHADCQEAVAIVYRRMGADGI